MIANRPNPRAIKSAVGTATSMSPKAPYLSSISRMSVLVRFALHGSLPYCALSHNHHTDLVHYCIPCLQPRRLYDPNLIWALHKQLWLLSLQQRTTERPCDVWCYKRDHKRRSSKPFLIGGIFLFFPSSRAEEYRARESASWPAEAS